MVVHRLGMITNGFDYLAGVFGRKEWPPELEPVIFMPMFNIDEYVGPL